MNDQGGAGGSSGNGHGYGDYGRQVDINGMFEPHPHSGSMMMTAGGMISGNHHHHHHHLGADDEGNDNDVDDDDDVSYEEKLLLNKNLATVISLTQNRRLRTSFSTQQIELLESVFVQTHYPDAGLREEIAHSTGLNDSKIQVKNAVKNDIILI